MTTELGKFEGHQIIGSKIKVTNTGDGLSQSMKVDPVKLAIGQKCFVVMETEVVELGFPQSSEDPENVVRVAKLRAGVAMIVDKDLVEGTINAQKIRLKEAAEGGPGMLNEEGDADPALVAAIAERDALAELAKMSSADLDLLIELQHLSADELDLIRKPPAKAKGRTTKKAAAKKTPAKKSPAKKPAERGPLSAVPDA